MAMDLKRESRLLQAYVVATTLCLAGLCYDLYAKGHAAYLTGDTHTLHLIAGFVACLSIGIYSNVLNQAFNLAYFKRKMLHRAASGEELEAHYDHADAPTLSVLIPSYKEEVAILKQTLISSAFTEYNNKNIVLLIDNPPHATTVEDILLLDETRRLPETLQDMFAERHRAAMNERAAFLARMEGEEFCMEAELARLAIRYDEAAAWVDQWIDEFRAGRRIAEMPHGERFFVETILGKPALEHRQRAFELRSQALSREVVEASAIARQYHRLVAMYDVQFSSFERKKYANFSHEANKAMNLNAYIALAGKSWGEMEIDGKLHLRETSRERALINAARTDYVIIIDADTLLTSDYALRLIHELELPGNEANGAIQTFPSAFPNCENSIERMAGASIDMGFRCVQGHRYFGGASWMGANAVIRRQALEDIQVIEERDGLDVLVTIPDMTVIEDNEASLAMLHAGWKVDQYPERMAFFSSPPDYGSLLIQRRRWANGGILLMPSLVRYAYNAPKRLGLIMDVATRFDYMNWAPIFCLTVLLLSFFSFGDIGNSPWVMVATVPALFMQMRVLKSEGYRYSDMPKLMAFSLMLIPVILGGTFKSLQQAFTGKKTPFARTPKVPQRTTAPALYCLVELAMPVMFLAQAYRTFQDGAWMQCGFACLNAGLIIYAIVGLMGLKPTLEDAYAGIRAVGTTITKGATALLPGVGALGQEI